MMLSQVNNYHIMTRNSRLRDLTTHNLSNTVKKKLIVFFPHA